MFDNLSPEAQEARREADSRRSQFRHWAEDGPRLHNGSIYVPSPFLNSEAAAFWRSQGFTFDRAEYSGKHEWVRDTNKHLNGKRYTSEAWLKAARRKYREFYQT